MPMTSRHRHSSTSIRFRLFGEMSSNRPEMPERGGFGLLVQLSAWSTLTAAVILVLWQSKSHLWTSGDTANLAQTTPSMAACLAHGVLYNCLAWASKHHGSVNQFPLIQNLPTMLMQWLGLDYQELLSALGWLNAASLVALCSVVVGWAYRRGGTRLAVVAGLLFVPGMLVAYAVQTFGEPLYAAAMTVLVLASLRSDKVSPFLLPAAAIATVCKETEAPFTVLIALAALAISKAMPAVRRRALLTVCIGAFVGELFNLAFNLFRYGTLLNYSYLDQSRSSLEMIPLNAVALLVSPNGGIVWFWPGVGVGLAVLIFHAVRPKASGSKTVQAGSLVALIALVCFALGLGFWWDPFGWYAWGPRLLMPLGAPLIVLAIAVISHERLSPAWTSTRSLVVLAIVGVLVLAPTLGAVFENGSQESSLQYAVWARRPQCTPVHISQALRDSCLRSYEWLPAAPPLLKSVPTSFSGYASYWVTLLLGAAAISLFALRAMRLRTPQRD